MTKKELMDVLYSQQFKIQGLRNILNKAYESNTDILSCLSRHQDLEKA